MTGENKAFKVLFVEDNEEYRLVISSYLQTVFPFELLIVDSGNKAVRILEETNFDLVITDYNMPDGNGKVVLDYLEQRHSETPAILFSAGDFPSALLSHPKQFRFIRKAGMDELTRTIENILKIKKKP